MHHPMQSLSGPVDNLSTRPLLLRRPNSLLAHPRLLFHGSLAGVQAGWDVPVQVDLDVLWAIPCLLDQLLQQDSDAWRRSGTHSEAKDDPVDMFRLVNLAHVSRAGLQPAFGETRVTGRESAGHAIQKLESREHLPSKSNPLSLRDCCIASSSSRTSSGFMWKTCSTSNSCRVSSSSGRPAMAKVRPPSNRHCRKPFWCTG